MSGHNGPGHGTVVSARKELSGEDAARLDERAADLNIHMWGAEP